MLQLDFVVKVLTGTPEELGRMAVNWGYDGIEFMPDPEHTPDPELFSRLLEQTGAVMPVVNSGRIAAQGMALLHEDIAVREKSSGKNQLPVSNAFWTLPATPQPG